MSTVLSVFVSPANREAVSLLPKEIQGDPQILPPESKLAKCEMMEDLGDTLLAWDKAWTEIKAGK
jgi:hypothetical protein